ncbi:hypothetical protein [Methylobacter psychrophilus]|uniref:hypothetical protein n=1 Tax=Methylobacter psychrophilus TaxID=96941 RepID=UPI0021D4C5A5|nr:hypothetical protein [Methylobacter psychrophilus]
MAVIDWGDILTVELHELENIFNKSELSYLALTSKFEQTFRDRLAYELHKKNPDYIVSREWKRVDLAILDAKNFAPVVLIELKAMYSFDMFTTKGPQQYLNNVQSDVEKMNNMTRDIQSSRPKLYTILISTHPHSKPDKKFDQVIKYAAQIRKYTPQLIDVLDEKVITVFKKSHPLKAKGTIIGGSAFNIDVSLNYWLFGPY